MYKANYHIFDFEGTIALDGKITPENKLILKKINKKVLNTASALKDLPKDIFKTFKYVMTLNGSKLYKSGKLIKKYSILSHEQVDNIILLAKKNGYCISFNSNKGPFYNVVSQENINYLNKMGLKHFPNIEVPKSVFFIALRDHFFVQGYKHFPDKNKHLLEISNNNKGNIAKSFYNFSAYGDNKNDVPMMKRAKKITWVKDANLAKHLKEDFEN